MSMSIYLLPLVAKSDPAARDATPACYQTMWTLCVPRRKHCTDLSSYIYIVS